jgi:cobalt-zinc-cadmium efflux system outer membrane protein
VQNNPDLAMARARAEAARGRLVQAGLYPNPVVTARIDELGSPENVAGFPAMTFSQEIVTARKIPLAKAAAAHGVAAADWLAVTRWYDAQTRVRTAYYELLTAEREVEANREVVRLAEEGLDAARKLLRAGTGTQPDVLRAEVERQQSSVRLATSQRRLEAAGRLLATAVGVNSLPAGGAGAPGDRSTPLVVGTLDHPVPVLEWQPLLEGVLERSSEVQEAQALVLQAEKLLARAEADACPNVTAAVRPIYNAPLHHWEVLLEFGGPVPIFNRNQGNILAARADVGNARASARGVELRLTERLALAYQRYQTARRQVMLYEKQILPRARESLRLIRIGYEKGDPKYDFTTLLQAQQTLAQARLVQVQTQGDLWRALSEIGGLLQQDGFPEDCTGMRKETRP